MDSQFQVKITADISELQSRLASVEAITGKFSQSMDKAAGAVKNMEQNANRGRMVAFAFGQVIRDAGFFSQSFGLGILAISNNIPILIDQLSLSIKALQPFAGALSLIGSILTAGLTVWAYSSQAIKKNKESIEDWRNSLDDAIEVQLRGTQSAQEEITKLDFLYKAATNVANSNKTRLEAAKQLQDLYPTIFGNLSKESIMLGDVGGRYDDLRISILSAAQAQAALNKIVQNSSRIQDNNIRILEAENKRIKLKAQYEAEYEKAKALSNKADKTASSMTGGGGQVDFFAKSRSIQNEILLLTKEINDAQTDTKILNNRNDILESFTQEKKSVDALVKSYSGYNKETERATSNRERISEKLYAKSTADEFRDIFKPIKGKEVKTFDVTGGSTKYFEYQKQGIVDMVNYMIQAEQQISQIFNEGIVNTISNSMMAVGAAIADGGNWAKSGMAALLGSMSNMFQQFGEQLIKTAVETGLLSIGIGKAIAAIKAALKNLNPFVAIAAGVALIALAGAARKGASNIAGGGSGAGEVAGVPTLPRQNPSFSLPTSFQTGAMAVSSQSNGILETRISGNDLVILMDRSSNNRNRYF